MSLARRQLPGLRCGVLPQCLTGNLCASCQAKRSALFAERLREEIVAQVAHRHVVFTIPKALRGLFERERSLLGLLSRTAFETVRRVLAAAGSLRGAVPGMVASIQTFGSFANVHPHIHALVTEGVFLRDGTFREVTWPPSSALEEAFRRLLLASLVRAERLSETGFDPFLSWRHSGFSVHGEQRLLPSEGDRLERLGRYVTRPALSTGAVTIRDDGRVEVATPPDPRTGSESIVLDALIPDARKHLVRYYGAYSHRHRGRARRADAHARAEPVRSSDLPAVALPPVVPAEPGSAEARRRSAWARVLQKVFEVDPLLCPRCKTEMKVVAWITDPLVIGRILAHRKRAGLESPFDERGRQRGKRERIPARGASRARRRPMRVGAVCEERPDAGSPGGVGGDERASGGRGSPRVTSPERAPPGDSCTCPSHRTMCRCRGCSVRSSC